MKRYFKIFFSRFFLVTLTIILLFALAVGLVFGLFYVLELALTHLFPTAQNLISLAADIIYWLILVVTVLHIVNRDMMPETKIPWILVVVVFNVFGVAIYAIFSHNRPARKQRKSYEELYERSRQHEQNSLQGESLSREMGRWADVSEALYSVNGVAAAYDGTHTEYFPTGEVFFERFLEDLKEARQFIFLEYFVIESGVMWDTTLEILREKVRAGVEVRVMYDDIGSMGKNKIRAGYYKKLRQMGILCEKFNPFVPIVTNMHNNRDHRKIAVIDGKIGYTGGINFADEYINVKQLYGHWKDTAVRLEGPAVRSFTLMFLRLYNLRKETSEDFSPYLPEVARFEGEGCVQPYGDGPRPLYGRHLGEDVYINILNGAKKYVWIMSPYLIIDYRMQAALLSAAARGVDVRIITPHIPDKKTAFALTRSNYMALIQGGVKIYEYTPGFIHAKSFLADDEIAVVGTINLDYRSFLHHFEDAVLMYRTRAVEQLFWDYEKTFSECALQTEEDAKKNVVWRGVCEFIKVFAPLF